MKIIHTSDWHLGHELYGYDRTEEQNAFFRQLCVFVSEERPDALLVSGDIFHTATPSNSVMKLFTDSLDQVRRSCPGMQTVIVAGNHDSGSRLDISSTLWEHLGVRIISKVARKDGFPDLDKHIVEIKGKDGETAGYVAAVPHIFPDYYPAVTPDTPRELRQQAFVGELCRKLSERNERGLPSVIMAHMAICGSDIRGHDEGRGGMDYVDAGLFSPVYDYLALGHIHCPQTLHAAGRQVGGGCPVIRYCGSPLAVSFDEDYLHSVTVAEISPGEDRRVFFTQRHVENPRPLVTVPEHPAPLEDALAELERLKDEKIYVRLNVMSDGRPHPDAMERAQAVIGDGICRLCLIKWTKAENAVGETGAPEVDVEKIRVASPIEIAEIYYKDRFGESLPRDMAGLFSEAVDEIRSRPV